MGCLGTAWAGAATDATASDGNACIKYGLQGAVMMHPGVQLGMGSPWIPSMFLTGTLDAVVSEIPGLAFKAAAKNGISRAFGAYKGYTHVSPCGPVSNKEVLDIVNWFGCFLWYNQDSCGSLASSFCNDEKNGSCQLIWSNNGVGDSSLWHKALETGDEQKVLAVPWGSHNGTFEGFMDEVQRRGEWTVAQRRKYLSLKRQLSHNTESTVGNDTQSTDGNNTQTTLAGIVHSGAPSIPGSDITLDNVLGTRKVKFKLTKPSDVGISGAGPWAFIGFYHALFMQVAHEHCLLILSIGDAGLGY